MKLINKLSRMSVMVAVLAMVLCLSAAQAVATISTKTRDKVETAAANGDTEALETAAYDDAFYGLDIGMTLQQVCDQIIFAAVKAASDSGRDIESALQAAADGVAAAEMKYLGRTVLDIETYTIAKKSFQKANDELSLGLDQEMVNTLKNRLLPKPDMPDAPVVETPDVQDKQSGSPI